jgi:hypothetical protein
MVDHPCRQHRKEDPEGGTTSRLAGLASLRAHGLTHLEHIVRDQPHGPTPAA